MLAALVLAALLTLLPAVPSGAAIPEARRAASSSEGLVSGKVCSYDWRRGTWQIKQLIRCAASNWAVPGGVATALDIANRESRFRPGAYNASGAAGIYQHLLRYWPGRAAAYGFRGWSAFNARANIIVTMRMVHAAGWGPWGH